MKHFLLKKDFPCERCGKVRHLFKLYSPTNNMFKTTDLCDECAGIWTKRVENLFDEFLKEGNDNDVDKR